MLYDRHYVLQEAWEWNVDGYFKLFDTEKRLAPADMRRGKRLYSVRLS
jgi:hypothetical protein